MVLMPRSVTNPQPSPDETSMPQGVDPRQMIMQMMMAQAGGGQGSMPQGAPPEMPMDEIPDAAPMQGPPDPRFGPQNDPARDQTESELETVSNSMGAEDEGIAAIAEQLRSALEEGNDEAVQQILGQMEEAGISIDDLPPDIRNQLDTGEGEVSTPAEEDEGEVE